MSEHHRTWHRVRDIAEARAVKQDIVLGWIARGELAAINVAATTTGRPRWRISSEALADFDRRRASTPQPKPERRRRPRRGNVIEFV